MFKIVLGLMLVFILGFIAAWQLRNNHDHTVKYMQGKQFKLSEGMLFITGSFKALNFPQEYQLNFVEITCKNSTQVCMVRNIVLFDNGLLYTDEHTYELRSIENDVILAEKHHNECEEQFLEIDKKSKTVLHKSVGKAFTGKCEGQHQLHVSELKEYIPEARMWID